MLTLKQVLIFLFVATPATITFACFTHSSTSNSAGAIQTVSGGSSPNQNDLPAIPAAIRSSCGHNMYYYNTDQPGSGIVGGITAAPNEYPWLIRLRISLGDGTSDLCGAALINNRWLITAGHCAKAAINASYITAIFADWDKQAQDTGEYSMGISLIKVHDQYSSSTNDYDFALLKLASDVSLTQDWKTQAICLPTSCSSECQPGTTAFIAGWGTNSETGSTAMRYLQKAYIKISDWQTCYNNYQIARTTITDRMMCAGWPNGGVDTCLGDSGGPLMVAENGYYKICGVTSFGVGCARVGYYGVYSKVCTVLPWITDVLARH